jgi:hypothetical protein
MNGIEIIFIVIIDLIERQSWILSWLNLKTEIGYQI